MKHCYHLILVYIPFLHLTLLFSEFHECTFLMPAFYLWLVGRVGSLMDPRNILFVPVLYASVDEMYNAKEEISLECNVSL